jgi:bifunctional non-homologous end joining protein LigD
LQHFPARLWAVSRLAFIRPLSPSTAVRPPKGDDWLHEPKWDGFRFQVIKDGSDVRLYSKSGTEYSDRLPGMVEAFAKLPARAAILDGELCLIDPRGAAHFYQRAVFAEDERSKLLPLRHQEPPQFPINKRYAAAYAKWAWA